MSAIVAWLCRGYDFSGKWPYPVLTGKRWAEDLLAGTGWRFEPIEGHVTEDLDRMRNIARRWGGHPKGLLFPNSF